MNRDIFIQKIRGICIIAVIMIHLPEGIIENGTFHYWLSFRQIINFPVAIFIFLSGYFYALKENHQHEWSGDLKKRLSRLVPSYLIWTVLYLLLQVVIGNKFTNGGLIMAFLTGNAAPPLYYLIVLMQLAILTPFVITIIKRKNKFGHYLCLSITPAWFILLYAYNFITYKQLPLYHVVFPSWFIFYYWGLTAKKSSNNEIQIRPQGILLLVLLLLSALFVSLFESNMIYHYTGLNGFASSQITVSSFVYAAIVIKLLFSIKPTIDRPSLLSKFGDYSFGIFFIHMLFLWPLINLFNRIALPGYLFLFQQVLITTLTLFLSYFSIYFAEKVFSVRMSKLFGLK